MFCNVKLLQIVIGLLCFCWEQSKKKKYRLNIGMICHCNTETDHTDNQHVTTQNHK